MHVDTRSERAFKVHYYVTAAAGKVAVKWIQLCYNLRTETCTFFTNLAESRDGNFHTRIVL